MCATKRPWFERESARGESGLPGVWATKRPWGCNGVKTLDPSWVRESARRSRVSARKCPWISRGFQRGYPPASWVGFSCRRDSESKPIRAWSREGALGRGRAYACQHASKLACWHADCAESAGGSLLLNRGPSARALCLRDCCHASKGRIYSVDLRALCRGLLGGPLGRRPYSLGRAVACRDCDAADMPMRTARPASFDVGAGCPGR